ncbi:hypothetical protein PIB30_060123 [Stylosanthes scabra]|uniref:Uncharacterized protein n=1 Tax=Stylosanthes scabra TaxID=79078 RepID=A0ABU6XKS3_9FABA|nr:hypothetical protein [Stylosanthes scabra]
MAEALIGAQSWLYPSKQKFKELINIIVVRLSPSLARGFKWSEDSVASSGLRSNKGLEIKPAHHLGPGPKMV